VFEHFWLRGLLSGAIMAEKNPKANDKPAKKETPKALLNKLVTALDAGQRIVKRLIQAKWDRGRYVAGMAGCARTWPTQMMQVSGLVVVIIILNTCSGRNDAACTAILFNTLQVKVYLHFKSRHRNGPPQHLL
jgi:hypothetical protein